MLSPTLLYLDALFPGLVVIPVVKVGTCLTFAAQTTRNKLHAGEFPVETFLLGGKRVVKKTDLAHYIDGLAKQRGPGRPRGSTKAARIACQTVSVDVEV